MPADLNLLGNNFAINDSLASSADPSLAGTCCTGWKAVAKVSNSNFGTNTICGHGSCLHHESLRTPVQRVMVTLLNVKCMRTVLNLLSTKLHG